MRDIVSEVIPLIAPLLEGKFVFIPAKSSEEQLSILYGDFRAEIDQAGHFSIRQDDRLVKAGEANSVQEALGTVLHLLPTFQMEITGLADAA